MSTRLLKLRVGQFGHTASGPKDKSGGLYILLYSLF